MCQSQCLWCQHTRFFGDKSLTLYLSTAERQQPEVTVPTVPKQPSPDAHTQPDEPRLSEEVPSKALRKAKEVTVKSRESTRVQTFAPKAQLEAEKTEVHDEPEQETNSSATVPANIKHATVTSAKVEDVTEPKRWELSQIACIYGGICQKRLRVEREIGYFSRANIVSLFLVGHRWR